MGIVSSGHCGYPIMSGTLFTIQSLSRELLFFRPAGGISAYQQKLKSLHSPQNLNPYRQGKDEPLKRQQMQIQGAEQ